MGRESFTQPQLPNQAACGEIFPEINGKHLQCNGTECPWMSKDKEQRSKDMKKLSRAVAFCVTFMVLEVVGGIKAGSLAILTDAAHLLSDVASFAISLFAMWAGGWEANLRQTYGFFRLEILGALVSIQIIWLITGIIVYEAFVRLFRDPVEIDGRLMFIIASLGLVVNLVMMFLLGHGHDHGHDHGHSHGSSDHSHGHSHGSNNKRTKHNNPSKDHHDHNEDSLRQPLLLEDHSHHHHHGEAHSHDHHANDEHSLESPAQGEKHSHHHHEDEQCDDPHNHGHEHTGEEVHHESNDISDMLTYTGDGLDQSAATLRQEGHKTECVQEIISKRRRGETISIMCICDQPERRSESDTSVSVTIDQGGSHDDHDGSSRGTSINVRGAYLHVLGDLIQSIGVMVGGAIIWYKPEWRIVDLFCTFFFSIVVLGTTIKMIRDVLDVLMESTPREVDAEALQRGLKDIDGVYAVHELHIWAITVGKVVLACHVIIRPDADSDELLQKVIQYCDQQYKISHVTIQIERLKP
ncbi:unnamed protein product [Calypogeia fissa]